MGNPLQVKLTKAPTASAIAKAEATLAKASNAKKLEKALASRTFEFEIETDALAVRTIIDSLRAKASSLRVIDDTPEARQQFAKDLAAKVERYSKNPDKFVNGNPKGEQFSQFIGGSARAQAREGVSFAEIRKQYVYVLGLIKTYEEQLDWMVEQVEQSLQKTKA
jgi:hypothetical protein